MVDMRLASVILDKTLSFGLYKIPKFDREIDRKHESHSSMVSIGADILHLRWQMEKIFLWYKKWPK
jgi:hypothetical protein